MLKNYHMFSLLTPVLILGSFFVFSSVAIAIPPVGVPIKLKVITGLPQTIDENATSSVITVESQDSSNTLADVTSTTYVTLSSDSATGVFSSTPASGPCNDDWGITQITIASGTAHKSFCYKDSSAGTHTLTISDSAGVLSSDSQPITINLVVIPDTTAPVITIDPYNTATTDQDITVTAATNEGTLNADSHTFTANGSFDFVATDLAGNISTSTVTITNIDKTTPTATTTAPSSTRDGQGYFVGLGSTVLTNSTTGQVLGANTSRMSEATRQRRLANIRRRLLEIKRELLLLEHPELREILLAEDPLSIIPTTTPEVVTTTTTSSSTDPVKKPFWKFW